MSLPLFDFGAVNEARDHAIAQVAQHAVDRRPTFLEEARACVVRYLEAHGDTAGEVLTLACKRAGITPPDDRAFGAAYLGLVKARRIEKRGTVRRERGHGTAGGNVWGLVR